MFAWNNKGHLLVLDSVERAKNIFKIDWEPELEYTDEELRDNFGLLRIINGHVVMGLTEEEKRDKKLAASYEISLLKSKLSETDYVACKIAEGDATPEEYADVLANRRNWRKRVDELMKIE